MRAWDWTYEKRAIWRFFEVNGYERSEPRWDGDHFFGGTLSTHTFATTPERLEAWLNDSMLWTIENIEAGGTPELVYAFRGFVQATAYRAELPGHGGSNLSDTWNRMKNYFEETLQGLSRERDEALAVMQDCLAEQGQLGPWRGRR